MRIVLKNITGLQRSIDTPDMSLASVWLQSWLPTMADDYSRNHFPWQIELWATQESEMSWMNTPMERRRMSPGMAIFIDEERCIALSDVFKEMAAAFKRHNTPKD